MTNSTFSAIVNSGKSLKIIKAELTIAGATNKEIKELTAGLSASREGWAFSNTLEFLGSELRTEADLYNKLISEKAINEARWIGDRNKIRLLSIRVATKLGAEFTEVPASENIKKVLKELIGSKGKANEEPAEYGLGLELGESDKPIEEPKKGKGKRG